MSVIRPGLRTGDWAIALAMQAWKLGNERFSVCCVYVGRAFSCVHLPHVPQYHHIDKMIFRLLTVCAKPRGRELVTGCFI